MRIHKTKVASKTILLLCGGDKSTQKRDIEQAKAYLADYKERSQ